jgi:hypothetical protein
MFFAAELKMPRFTQPSLSIDPLVVVGSMSDLLYCLSFVMHATLYVLTARLTSEMHIMHIL